MGEHCVKTYSTTQDSIALSSGESEYYGIVKASCQGIGVRSVLEDLGVPIRVRVCTDSSAAKSISCRRGVGRVRHIDTRELWVQERVSRGDITVVKVMGENNLADILTKYVSRDLMDKHLQNMSCYRVDGRHTLAPCIPKPADP